MKNYLDLTGKVALITGGSSGIGAAAAAVMADLDLVISSDTSVAHLAGALGRPVWTALAASPEWRWGLERSDSPWYPTMRLFRQTTDGDWNPVVSAMAKALQDLSAGA